VIIAHGNKTIKRICFCLFLSLLAAAASADARVRGDLPAAKSSVVTIFINNGNGEHVASGSGFVADEEGMIATSCRLLTKWLEKVEYSISVELDNGTVYQMDHVISNSCKNDLVMIKINAGGLPAAKISAGNRLREGERVYVISRRPEAKVSIFNSVIKTIRKKSGIFHLGLSITSQQDGSAVFNPSGEVVGILALPGKKTDHHIVVPAKYILKELSKCRVLEREITANESSRTIPAAPTPAKIPENAKNSAVGDGRDTAKQALSLATSYEKSGMYKEAIEVYKRALKLDPDRVDSYVSLGLDYYKIGKYSEAVDAYKQAIKIKPDEQSAYNKLAAVYILLGEYSLALDAFKESLKTDPQNPDTHFNLGIAYILSGDRDGAVDEYTILRELDKNRADKLLELIY
jgi:tetratricopeptide (TPR) repeat protein